MNTGVPASFQDTLSMGLLASKQLSLDKGAEEPSRGDTGPHSYGGSLPGGGVAGSGWGRRGCLSCSASPSPPLSHSQAKGRGQSLACENWLRVSPSYTRGPPSPNGSGSLVPWWGLWTWGCSWYAARHAYLASRPSGHRHPEQGQAAAPYIPEAHSDKAERPSHQEPQPPSSAPEAGLSFP